MRTSVLGFGLALVIFVGQVGAAEDEYGRYEAGFKNFLTCELTRTDAVNHFKGQAFTITMINLHNIQVESGMVILTGAVQCFVKDTYKTLYPAVGVEKVAGREKVSYYTIRNHDFSILGSELIRYPYKLGCPWSRYWTDPN